MILERAIAIRNTSFLFYLITMNTNDHVIWHAMDKHEKNVIYNYKSI
jgi:hypothetical protein